MEVLLSLLRRSSFLASLYLHLADEWQDGLAVDVVPEGQLVPVVIAVHRDALLILKKLSSSLSFLQD